jgi:hypothetical protein
VADLDTRCLILVLNMLGSSHDGEKLAALARAEAMLKAAGKTWGDLVGNGGRSAGGDLGTLRAELQAQRVALARDRATFETEKALWAAKQKQWHDSVSKDQQERLKRQHEEDLARCRAASEAPEPEDDPRYGDDPDDVEIITGVEAQNWENFKARNFAEAEWITDNLSWDFAASLFTQVKTRGSLSAKQMDAIRRGIARAEERGDEWKSRRRR